MKSRKENRFGGSMPCGRKNAAGINWARPLRWIARPWPGAQDELMELGIFLKMGISQLALTFGSTSGDENCRGRPLYLGYTSKKRGVFREWCEISV